MSGISPTDLSTAPKRGVSVIEAALETMPLSPGVYRMLDAKGDALYVGKARSLKKRVGAYVQLGRLSERLLRMVGDTVSMEIVTTHTEAEALLLEANLIKRLKPRFNIVLRDDKSYPWLMLTEDHALPADRQASRGAQVRKGSYWGPFASAWAVNQTVTAMQRVFLLRSCADTVFANRSRPCLLHQIKRCSAPCVGRISRRRLCRNLVAQAKAFLAGKEASRAGGTGAEMEQASERRWSSSAPPRCATASAWLTHVQGSGVMNPELAWRRRRDRGLADRRDRPACRCSSCAAGRNNGNRAFFPDAHQERGGSRAVLAAFIAQFYDDKPPPPLLLVNQDIPEQELVAEALSLKAGTEGFGLPAGRVEIIRGATSAARSGRWCCTRN